MARAHWTVAMLTSACLLGIAATGVVVAHSASLLAIALPLLLVVSAPAWAWCTGRDVRVWAYACAAASASLGFLTFLGGGYLFIPAALPLLVAAFVAPGRSAWSAIHERSS